MRSRSLPCLQPAGALPGGRLPARGSLGPPCPTCTGTLRRSACPRPLSGGFPWRSPPRYLACVRPSWGPSRARDPADAPGHARAWGHPLPQAGPGGQGDRGLSHVPACPRGLPAPLSAPGGVLPPCPSAARTAAFRRWPTGGLPLPPTVRVSLLSTTLPLAGLQHAACGLAPPGFVWPLTGRHAGSLLTGGLGGHPGGCAPSWLAPTGEQQPMA